MSDPMFTTIRQHWCHFLERDIAPDAPPVQVHEMKRAFAAGAISGLQLAVAACTDNDHRERTKQLMNHINKIKELVDDV